DVSELVEPNPQQVVVIRTAELERLANEWNSHFVQRYWSVRPPVDNMESLLSQLRPIQAADRTGEGVIVAVDGRTICVCGPPQLRRMVAEQILRNIQFKRKWLDLTIPGSAFIP